MNVNLLDDDELDAYNLIVFGIPRQLYLRPDYFHSFDNLDFFRRFRLQKNTVLHLLTLIEHRLEFPYDTNNAVSPMDQLLICLRFYATGNHLIGVADFGNVHVSTVSRIVRRVSEAIAAMYNRFIYFPRTPAEIQNTQIDFFRIASFPRVVGTVDGSHIKIQSPGGNDAEIYRNRKGYFSINVQVICNANLEALDVVARWPGSTHDATIFNNSRINARFERGDFSNCLLLGDSGYHAKNFLLTPLLNPVTEAENLYNQSHIRTRNTVERFFGVWKRRFPVMAYGCRLKLNTLLIIIISTAILHNIARRMGENDPPEPENVDFHEIDRLIENGRIPNIPNHNQGVAGVRIRNDFICNYFARLE